MAEQDTAKLLEGAMELSSEARLKLATDLLESVEGPEGQQWESAWLAELDRRAAGIERGDVQLEDWADVKAKLLEDLQR